MAQRKAASHLNTIAIFYCPAPVCEFEFSFFHPFSWKNALYWWNIAESVVGGNVCISTNVERDMTLRNLNKFISSWETPPYKVIIASSPSLQIYSFDVVLLKPLAHSLKCKCCVALLRACPFPTPNNLETVSHPVIAWTNSMVLNVVMDLVSDLNNMCLSCMSKW